MLSEYASKLYGEYTESDFSIVGVNSADGTAIVNAEGDVEFIPAANLNGIVSFELIVTDGTENYTDLVEINVNPINDVLIANNDTITTQEDTSITILPSELFGNDINNDVEKSLNISQISNLANGTAVLSKAGVIRFIPDSNFNGIASFDYTVTDGIDSETALVEVIVNSVNDAPLANNDNYSYTAFEGISITISATELLSNDSDVEGDSLSIVGVESNDGIAIINADRNIEFTPVANFNGIASFDYTVTDGTNNSVASVEVIVNPVNNAIPVDDDTATTNEDAFLVISATELLSNDSDVEGNSLSIIGVGSFNNGTATLNKDGNIEFIPAANFNGIATFDYVVTDGTNNSVASVEVIVNPINDAPIASNDTATAIDEDTSITILATELLGNDSDVEGDSLSITEVNSSNGTAVINESGNIEFTPNLNFYGTASFDYVITDGTSDTTASVEVTVNPVNDPVMLTGTIADFTVGQAGSDRLYLATNKGIVLTDTQVTGDGTDTIANLEYASLIGGNS